MLNKEDTKKMYKHNMQLKNYSIIFSNVTAKWIHDTSDNSINNINLTVRSGELITIIGPVGAGKVHCIAYRRYV